ncbi:MAG: sodium:calcium antiporter [Anaerolineales bacterium]|nr:sodium:calcium antiporter [Anaerolineales bacterium]
MVWITFIVTSILIVIAAHWLAKYGDVIAVRTRLGGMFIGMLLLAGATSLPEVLTTVSSLAQGVPNLAAGNLLGSNMFNMLLLAILDLLHRKDRILRKAALKHALTGSVTMFLISLVVFFILADIEVRVGWIGLDSVAILLAYGVGVWLIRASQPRRELPGSEEPAVPEGTPSLRRGLIGFGIAALALTAVTPLMVGASAEIAELTGLGTTFVGTTLVALVTSLPELVTTVAAVRIGSDDMAIGNLFGSNMFNMMAVGLTDVFYLQGRFLGVIDPAFLLVGMLGLLMTGLGLIGNLARLERRVFYIEMDALALMLLYIAGLVFLYSRGIAH